MTVKPTAGRLWLAGATLASSSLFSLITLLIGFVATPYFLRWLGEERFGAFRALSDWGAYLSLLDLGLGGALAAVVSRAATQSESALEDAVAAGGRAYRRVALLVALAAMAQAAAMPWLVEVSPPLRGELQLAAWLSVVGSLALPFLAIRPAVEALQRGYLINAALVAQSLAITFAGLLLAWRGAGIPGMVAANLVGAVIFSTALTVTLRRIHPRFTRCLLRGAETGHARSELKRLRLPTLLSRLSGTVALLSDNIIIAWALGPAVVVPFFISQRLPALAVGQLQSLGSATWAGLSQIHHAGDHANFRARVLELTRLTTLLNVALLGPILVFNRTFVTLWVGSGNYGGDALTGLAVLNGAALSILSFWAWLFAGTGKAPAIVPMNLVAAAINLMVSLAATVSLGLVGPLLGTLCGCFVCAWQLPRLMRKHFGFGIGELAAAVIGPAVRTAPPIVAAAFVIDITDYQVGWLGLATTMATLAATSLVWGWFVTLTADERHRWGARLPRIWARTSGK